jgi:hypothetical protein
LKAVSKAFLLNEHFQPGLPLPLQVQPLKLRFGEMVEIFDGRSAQD